MTGSTGFMEFEQLVQDELPFFEVDSKFLRDFFNRASKIAEPVVSKLRSGDSIKTILSSFKGSGLQVSSANLFESIHEGPKSGVSSGFAMPELEAKTATKVVLLGALLYFLWDAIVAILAAAVAALATKGVLLLAIVILFALAVDYLIYKLNGKQQESLWEKIKNF